MLWTEEELMILKDTSLSNREVCEITGRSYSAVKIKRRELNISPKKDIDYWTIEEIKTLQKNKHLNNKKLAKILNRTPQSISIKRNKLNIPYIDNKWDEEEIEYLIENYPHQSNIKTAKYIGRTVTAVNSMAHELGLTRRNDYWTTDEIKILSENISLSADDLEKIIKTKNKKQILYKKTHLKSVNTKNIRNEEHIDQDVLFSKGSKVARIISLLSVLEVGESFELLNNEYSYFLEARAFVQNKLFKSKKETEHSRRVWRLD